MHSKINDEGLQFLNSWKFIFLILFPCFYVLPLVLCAPPEFLAYRCLLLLWLAIYLRTLLLLQRKFVVVTCLHVWGSTSEFPYCWISSKKWSFGGWFSFEIWFVYSWGLKLRVGHRGLRLRLHGGNKIFSSPVEKVKFILGFEESGSILIFHSVISFFVLFASLAPGRKLEVRLVHGGLSSQLQINGLVLEKIIGFDAVHTHAMLDNLLILIFLLLLMEIFLVDSWTSFQRDLQLRIFLLQTSVDHN